MAKPSLRLFLAVLLMAMTAGQLMAQSGGTITREETSRSATTTATTTERPAPGAAMEKPGMSQSPQSPMSTGQPGTMMGGSRGGTGTTSSSGGTTAGGMYTGPIRDYRTMSNEELNRMMSPQQFNTLTPGQQAEVRREFSNRIGTFTLEERQRYLLGSSKSTMGEAR